MLYFSKESKTHTNNRMSSSGVVVVNKSIPPKMTKMKNYKSHHGKHRDALQSLIPSSTVNHTDMICNNCGKKGHLFFICKIPITSIGVIAFRKVDHEVQYLMIRRKDTLGYIDFMRGKFAVEQKQYIMNMILQMTKAEKNILLQKSAIVKQNGNISLREKIVELIRGIVHPDTGEHYNLESLILESKLYCDWDEPEWGFPKGRRNAQENDYDCAIREFSEETGYSANVLTNVRNIVPMEEVFTGSNYNSYRHKYYLMNISYENSMNSSPKFQKSEVSEMKWWSLKQCVEKIRPYNLEKIQLIQNIDRCLQKTRVFSMTKI